MAASSSSSSSSSLLFMLFYWSVIVDVFVRNSSTMITATGSSRPRSSIHVYTTAPLVRDDDGGSTTTNNQQDRAAAFAVARKQQFDLQQLSSSSPSSSVQVVFTHSTRSEQEEWIDQSCSRMKGAYQKATMAMQNEIFKWCVLANTGADRTVVLDSESPIISLRHLAKMILMDDDDDDSNPKDGRRNRNIAVRDDALHLIHGGFILMDRSISSSASLPATVLDFLSASPDDPQNDANHILQQRRAVAWPRKLYELMGAGAADNNNQEGNTKNDWYFLSLECEHAAPTTTSSTTPTIAAAAANQNNDRFTCRRGYCCSVQDTTIGQTLLFQRHHVHPPRLIPPTVTRDDNATTTTTKKNGTVTKDPYYAATIAVTKFAKPAGAIPTPNMYEILQSQKCLPDHEKCFLCLREKKGATCQSCHAQCGCFCPKLCEIDIPTKHIGERWDVASPPYEREPDRNIPRIVHQTWYETLDDPLKYPNMSRMVRSFQQSGWEYRFYTDADAETFLSHYFPPAVLQTYRILQPGAFKADLFRYCVLLIHGGVYADVDIQLESNLDIAIPPDASFVVPVDEPGRPVHKQMCLWNGLIASIPAHPFLAQAIETIVNQVRNRFTIIDIDATYCPDPELSILHAYDTLFTAGPCLLGASMNRVLQRPWQQSHIPGSLRHPIFGRTIILHQNKWDMGAHRFTNIEQNLVVAATDLPDGDDIANLLHNNHKDGSAAVTDPMNADNADATAAAQRHLQQEQKADAKNHPHYSTAHAKSGIYGLSHLYDPNFRAVDEEIRINVVAAAPTATTMK